MENVFKSPKTYMVAGLAVIVITASAWQLKEKKQAHDTTATNNYANADTTKPHKHGYDKAGDGIKDVDSDMVNITIDLSSLDTTIEQTVRQALACVNVNEIVHDALGQVKGVDWKEINQEINQSLKEAQHEINNINGEEIDQEIKQSLKEAQDEINLEDVKNEIDTVKLHQIIKDALRNVRVNINGHRRV